MVSVPNSSLNASCPIIFNFVMFGPSFFHVSRHRTNGEMALIPTRYKCSITLLQKSSRSLLAIGFLANHKHAPSLALGLAPHFLPRFVPRFHLGANQCCLTTMNLTAICFLISTVTSPSTRLHTPPPVATSPRHYSDPALEPGLIIETPSVTSSSPLSYALGIF